MARIFEATGWTTSQERLLEPFKGQLSEDGQYGFYLNQGVSGVRGRPSQFTDHGEPVIEIRTGEIWGSENLRDFQRYLKTIQYIGGTLKAYQKLPLEIRDRILLAEKAGNSARAEGLAWQYESFDRPQEKDLALLWVQLRRDARTLFQEKNLTDPMREYAKIEFTDLAKCLPTGEKARPDKFKFMYNMRKLLTKYRAQVSNIIE